MNNKKTKLKIGIVTGSRADYGLLKELVKILSNDTSIDFKLFVTGSHLCPEFDMTYKFIEQDGFQITDKIEMLLSTDSKFGVSKSVGLGVISFTETFKTHSLDFLIVLGDRYEIFSATQAAMFLNIKIVHIHGGEITQGVIDDNIRHAISKMSNVHFVSAEDYRNRLIRMGEAPNTVFNVGAPSLDTIRKIKFLPLDDLVKKLDIKLNKYIFLVTFHPLTLNIEDYTIGLKEIFFSLKQFDNCTIIFTSSNADPGGREITKKINDFSKAFNNVYVFNSLGSFYYLSLLKVSDIVIGNSSSGIIEAPFLKTPTINIGDRQKGRLFAKSVVNVNANSNEIILAIKKVLSTNFQKQMKLTKSLYGNGYASKRIVNLLKNKKFSLKKLFYDGDQIL